MIRIMFTLFLLVGLTSHMTAYAADADRVYFRGIDEKSVYALVEKNQEGKLHLSVAGVPLKPETDNYVELVEEGYLSGLLSSDKARLLVSLGHVDEKNVWVINLTTKQLEFTSHENIGRHVFPKWLSSSSFELVYGGMGYRVEREFWLDHGSWKMTKDTTVEEE